MERTFHLFWRDNCHSPPDRKKKLIPKGESIVQLSYLLAYTGRIRDSAVDSREVARQAKIRPNIVFAELGI